jgi:hypothetical protein
MKNIISIFVLFLITPSINGQILTNSVPASSISDSNAFLDASTSYSSIAGENNNKHKGMVFPDVNLTIFQFENIISDGATFPSYYDGMIVYNSGTGNSATGINNPSTATNITPGFYYFSNPNGGANGSVTAGVWTALGSGGSGGGGTKDITTTAAPTDTKVNGKQVFAINGTFTASGTSTKITVPKPTGMTGYFKFSTYSNGALFRGEIHSFDVNAVTNNVVLGNGFFSEVYPAGTYEYVLEYFTQ